MSELVTGIDIVREQIRIAAGEPLGATGRARERGHAIEIRINAEDPPRAASSGSGRDHAARAAARPGVRVDTALRSGSEIPPYYDSMIAKLIVWDDTREAAIARTERALRELDRRHPTTRDLALDVLASQEFRSGDYSTSTLAELEDRLPSLAPA